MHYKYKNYVTITDIKYDDNFRFFIEADLENGNKNEIALVIMKNPSKANRDESDQTINRVLEIMYESGYGKCYIMNLIPYYATNSSDIAKKAEENENVYKLNDNLLKAKMELSTKIFVAWGGNSGFDISFYNSRIKKIQTLLNGRQVYCYKTNKSGTPIHPSRNQWKKGITDNDFVIYNF